MGYRNLFEQLDKTHPNQNWMPEVGKDKSLLSLDERYELRSLAAEFVVRNLSFNGRVVSTEAL